MTDVTVERPAAERSDGGDDPSVPPSGVALTRLIAMARLPPRQAVEIGAQVLAAADTDGVLPGRVLVDVDGRVALAPDPVAPDVAAVLADVVAAAHQHSGRAAPGDERLLAELDRALAELPVADVPVVARRLQEAAAGLDRGAVRAELAALSRAIDGGSSAAPRTRAAAPAARPGSGTASGTAGSGTTMSTRRRIGAWLLSLVALAALVALEVAFLRDDITTDIERLLDAGRSGSEATATPGVDGLPLEAPAPTAAGSVTAVDLRPLAECAPGAPCALRLVVGLAPGAQDQPVTWSYLVVDRCSGAAQTVPGGTVTVPPEGGQTAVVGTVALPAVPAVAVFAVTDLPAAAASAPVSFGTCLPDDQAQ
jgi:hypothetical protein